MIRFIFIIVFLYPFDLLSNSTETIDHGLYKWKKNIYSNDDCKKVVEKNIDKTLRVYEKGNTVFIGVCESHECKKWHPYKYFTNYEKGEKSARKSNNGLKFRSKKCEGTVNNESIVLKEKKLKYSKYVFESKKNLSRKECSEKKFSFKDYKNNKKDWKCVMFEKIVAKKIE